MRSALISSPILTALWQWRSDLEFKDPAVKARVEQADKLTKETFGKNVYIRGIIEFSNCCRKNCNYCGIRRGNTCVIRYQMTPDEIVAKAEENLKHGIKTIVLQSGEDLTYTKEIGSGMCNNTLHRRADRG